MSKLGFEPKWTPLHDKRAEQFEKIHLKKGKQETASDHDDFMKWVYGKKS